MADARLEKMFAESKDQHDRLKLAAAFGLKELWKEGDKLAFMSVALKKMAEDDTGAAAVLSDTNWKIWKVREYLRAALLDCEVGSDEIVEETDLAATRLIHDIEA